MIKMMNIQAADDQHDEHQVADDQNDEHQDVAAAAGDDDRAIYHQ